MIGFKFFVNHNTVLPIDCLQIISEYIPHEIHERCFVCGEPLIWVDKRGRLFFVSGMICSECIILCEECFESNYE
mgnify:CR=1 FL=1